MASSLHYLTVQDILWINLQVTKKVHHFNYARLEEATYYQYAYGESNSLFPQAARFLSGFLKMHPLDAGNEATAFVACAAFLRLNQAHLDLTDETAAEWMGGILSKRVPAREALAQAARNDLGHDHHEAKPDIRANIVAVLNAYPCTILELAAGAPV